MIRLTRWLAVGLVFGASVISAFGQNLLPKPPDQIEGILDLVDAVDAAELAVMGGTQLTDTDLATLEALARVADRFDASDLAARTRSLIVLARPRPAEIAAQESVTGGLRSAPQQSLVRGTHAYDVLAYSLAATGGTSLALAGVFYALAESNYRSYLNTTNPVDGPLFFEAWRGYDLLGLGMGATLVASVGVGLPLLYAIARDPSSLAPPAFSESYTAAERDQQLLALYAQRARIVTRLNALPTGTSVWELASTIGLASGVVGTIASATMFFVGSEIYKVYLDETTSSATAESLGAQVQFYDALAVISGFVAAAGFGTSAGIAVMTQNRDELESALREVNRRIVDLRTATPIDVPPTATATSAQ